MMFGSTWLLARTSGNIASITWSGWHSKKAPRVESAAVMTWPSANTSFRITVGLREL